MVSLIRAAVAVAVVTGRHDSTTIGRWVASLTGPHGLTLADDSIAGDLIGARAAATLDDARRFVAVASLAAIETGDPTRINTSSIAAAAAWWDAGKHHDHKERPP